MTDNRLALWLTGCALIWCAGVVIIPQATILLTLCGVVYGIMRGLISIGRQIGHDLDHPAPRGKIGQVVDGNKLPVLRDR